MSANTQSGHLQTPVVPNHVGGMLFTFGALGIWRTRQSEGSPFKFSYPPNELVTQKDECC
jgi:hypothetical protein